MCGTCKSHLLQYGREIRCVCSFSQQKITPHSLCKVKSCVSFKKDNLDSSYIASHRGKDIAASRDLKGNSEFSDTCSTFTFLLQLSHFHPGQDHFLFASVW